MHHDNFIVDGDSDRPFLFTFDDYMGDGVQLSLLKGDSLMTERVYLRASLAR